MRDSRITRSIKSLPPRGTMMSTYSFMERSCPTAARSVVSTTCTASSGRPAAQDAGVARFQAQRRGVGGDVGARFVDDADHAQRHAHPADLDSGRLLLQ